MKSALVAGLALLATVQLSPAQANDMPADVSIKGDYARVFMYLGDRLRRIRPLAENCRQETREWAATVEADEKSKLGAPLAKPVEFGRRYDISSITGGKRYVSVVRMTGADIDGVYNAIEEITFLWDSRGNQRISLAGFFSETTDGGRAMTRLLTEATNGLVEQIGKARAADAVSTLRPALTQMGPISLAPSTTDGKSSGLNFHFAVPAPGIFHLKPIVVFVPWTRFKGYLSPHGRSIFGGKWRDRYIW